MKDRLLLGLGAVVAAGAVVVSRSEVSAEPFFDSTPAPTPTADNFDEERNCKVELAWASPSESAREEFISGSPNICRYVMQFEDTTLGAKDDGKDIHEGIWLLAATGLVVVAGGVWALARASKENKK